MTSSESSSPSDTTRSADLLTASIGNEYAEFGRTSVTVTREGGYTVENVTDGARSGYEADMGSTSSEEIFDRVRGAAFWTQPSGQRPGIPDEARLELALNIEGRTVGHRVLWESEAEEDAVVAWLLGRIREAVAQATDRSLVF